MPSCTRATRFAARCGLGGPQVVQLLDLLLHAQRRPAGAGGMRGLEQRGVPERHHRVAHELVDGAALGEDDVGQRREQPVEEGDQLLRRQPSAMLVKPRTSANSTVTSRVSPPSFSLSWLRASSSTSGAAT